MKASPDRENKLQFQITLPLASYKIVQNSNAVKNVAGGNANEQKRSIRKACQSMTAFPIHQRRGHANDFGAQVAISDDF